MFGDEETFTTPTGWCTSNYGIVEMGIFKPMLGVSGWLVTEESEGHNGKSALLRTINSKGGVGGLIPTITTGSLFLGTWSTNASNTLNSTKFGNQFNNSLGRPVAVKGWYKYEYESGKDFYTCESDATDKATIDVSKGEYADQYSIKVSLYTTEEYDETGFSDYLTGESGDNNFYTSSRVVAKGGVEGGSTDGQWKEFTITLDYGDAEFDINQKYRFAIVCSSSKEGDKFWGAPESKLWVDDIEVIYKK